MSNEVAVFNANVYPYKEFFRERMIEIPANGHIMMDRDEAKLFLGTMNLPVLDADGNHTPQGYKMLKILGDKAPELTKSVEYNCNACAEKFENQVSLEKHILAKHVEQLEDKEVAKKLEIKLEKPSIPKGAKTARNA